MPVTEFLLAWMTGRLDLGGKDHFRRRPVPQGRPIVLRPYEPGVFYDFTET